MALPVPTCPRRLCGDMKPITDGIFHDEVTVSLGLGFTLPARTTFVRLSSGKLGVISPGPQSEESMKWIEQKDPEPVLIAPNMFHHLYLKKMYERFPKAKIYGPKPLPRVKQPWLEGVMTDIDLLQEDLKADFQCIRIEGHPALGETALLHRPTKALIVTDLMFNIFEPMPVMREILLKIVGAYNKPRQSKLLKWTVKDKQVFKQSCQSLLDLDFDLAISAHGDVMMDPKEFIEGMTASMSRL